MLSKYQKLNVFVLAILLSQWIGAQTRPLQFPEVDSKSQGIVRAHETGEFAINLHSTLQPVDLESWRGLALFEEHPPYITQFVLNAQLWYRLRVGYYATRAEAERVMFSLTSTFPQAWVTKVPLGARERSEQRLPIQNSKPIQILSHEAPIQRELSAGWPPPVVTATPARQPETTSAPVQQQIPGTPTNKLNASAQQSPALVLHVGHWIEVRGKLLENNRFLAEQVRIMEPDKHDVLVGTVVREDVKSNSFYLLGQPVRFSKSTEFGGISPGELVNRRVKVQGYFRGSNTFSAREVSPRGSGRDRIAGRIDELRLTSAKTEAIVMNYTIEFPRPAMVLHEKPVELFSLTAPKPVTASRPDVSEDDLFGDGIAITNSARLKFQLQGQSTQEDNLDLDSNDAEDRLDNELSVRARLEIVSNDILSSVVELRHRALFRDDDEDGRLTDRRTRLGEAYAYLRNPFISGLDFQIGRQDFDDDREWIYDENLDGIRAIMSRGSFRGEFSLSTILSGGNVRDEESTNWIAYLSNERNHRKLGGYLIHRDIATMIRERTTHLGVRALGEWLPHSDSWLELVWMDGNRGEIAIEGFGVDIGNTWLLADGVLALTVGYALGEGGDIDASKNRTFRQTGFQDNNARFGGVTSFKYYGELFDPELANLQIITAGIGISLSKGASFDLVGHHYRQDRARTKLIETDIDDRANGINPDLGWEIDAILGWRNRSRWDLEIVGAYFQPGRAFDEADDAFLAKIQLRYRH